MFEQIRALIQEFRQNPLSAFCALMVAAIVYLVLMLIEQQNQKDALYEAFRTETLAIERRCAQDQERINAARMDDLRAANERQSRIEAELRKLKFKK